MSTAPAPVPVDVEAHTAEPEEVELQVAPLDSGGERAFVASEDAPGAEAIVEGDATSSFASVCS